MENITELTEKLKSAEGVKRIEVLINLASELNKSDIEQAEEYAREATELSEKLNEPFFAGRSHYVLGRTMHQVSRYQDARRHYEIALDVLRSPESAYYRAACCNNLGALCQTTGNMDAALNYYLKSLPIWEELKDISHLAATLNNIGIVYEKEEEFDQALSYHMRSLNIRVEENNQLAMAQSYNNIGIIHEKQANYSEALLFFKKSLTLKEKIGDRHSLAVTYSNAGNCHTMLRNYDLALEYMNDALLIFEELDEKYGLAVVQNGIGAVHGEKGDTEFALDLLFQNLAHIRDNSLKDLEYRCTEIISNVYEKQGNYKSALEWNRKSAKVEKEIYNEQKIKQIAEMQTRFDLQTKEREAEIYRLKNIELAEAYQRVKQLARRDDLTGLPNRRDILETLESEHKRQQRSGKINTIIISDLDLFKQINDEFGHLTGDYVLKEVGRLLVGNLRGQDKVCRWGGEEFLFFLPETDISGGRTVAENLRVLLENHPFVYRDNTIRITMTFGLVVMKSDANLEQTIRLADQALYRGKELGRNKVICADDMKLENQEKKHNKSSSQINPFFSQKGFISWMDSKEDTLRENS